MGWVETERRSLVETLRSADPGAPTLCAGWDVRRLLAHLVQREHSLAASVGDLVTHRPPGAEPNLGRLVEAARTPEGYRELLERFLAGPPRWSPMSWAGESFNLVEYVIHHEDVRRGAGPVPPRTLPAQQQQAIWERLGLPARMTLRKSPVGVRLAGPSGSVLEVGKQPDPVVVSGPPVELALWVSGRHQAADVELSGPAGGVAQLEAWLGRS